MDQVAPSSTKRSRRRIGISSKKWALVLVALVVGAMGAVWLVRRARSAEPAAAPVTAETT